MDRSFHHKGLQQRSSRGRAAVGLCDFPDGFLRDIGNDRFRRDGRADQVLRLLHLLRGDFAVHLSGERSLDLGRRLAGGNGIPRLCRIHSGAHGRRRLRADRRKDAGAAHRQVRQGRQAPGDPGPQPFHRRAGRIHPLVLLVRLQRRFHRGHGQRRAD